MRKRQQELSYSDSTYTGSNTERFVMRTVESLGREIIDFSGHHLLPERKKHSMKLVCLECGTRFTSKSTMPSCPRCLGGDIELQ